MSTVGVFHPVTQHSWQTSLAFQEAGRLRWFATSLYYDPARWPYRVERFLPGKLAAKIHREFERRVSGQLDPALVRQLSPREWVSVALRRLDQHRLEHWLNEMNARAFGASVIRLIEREPVNVAWGYDTTSLEVFRWARKRGIRCVLDQTIGHPASFNKALLAEKERHPDFFLDSFEPFDQAWIDRANEEIALADLVVVGSTFCRDTLIENGCPPEKIRVVPYGADEALFPGERPRREPLANRPVEFLFVGSVEPRKGVAYLLEAMAQIQPERGRLTMVGRMLMPGKTFERFAKWVRHVPQVSRAEVVSYFLMADCFVFPSLFEGGGIVLYEACRAALGVIQSAMCGDGVREALNGIVLSNVSTESVLAQMRAVIDDRQLLAEWQDASWEHQGERTWAVYRDRVRDLA